MNLLTLILIGIVLLVALGVFSVYATLAVRHAIRFRAISKRSVYLSLGFLVLSAVLILSSLSIYLLLVFN